jgi:invasion protein IalB
MPNPWRLRGIITLAAAACAVVCTPALAKQPQSGVGIGIQAEDEAGLLERGGRKKTRCLRWRAVARRLGETYAGHLLRRTVVRRECGPLEIERVEDIWDWPWVSLTGGQLLPPRRHAAMGDWEVYCARVGSRRRCALINRSSALSHDDLDQSETSIVTHFVIDTIAGRESMLWRVFVPLAPAAVAIASSRDHADPGDHAAGVRLRARTARLVYRPDGVERSERFTVCSASGCLMEANVRHSGQVATRLSDGRPLEAHIVLGPGHVLDVTLPARGFHAGLSELVRLRREERRFGVKPRN